MPSFRRTLRELRERRAPPVAPSTTRTFQPDQLPPAEAPAEPLALKGHTDWARRVVVLPDGAHFATACSDGHVRVFALDGDGNPVADIPAHRILVYGLAALGGDVLVSGGEDEAAVATWSASTGDKLDAVDLRGEGVTAIAALGRGRFAVATRRREDAGADVVLISHTDGVALREESRVEAAHGDCVRDLAVHGDTLCTASGDKTAGVWNASSGERRAMLRGHTDFVTSIDANEQWIATGSRDRSVRVYRNGGDYALVAALGDLHNDWVWSVSILSNSTLMTGSDDKTLCFTPLSGDAAPVARVQCGGVVRAATVLPDARIAVGGVGNARTVFQPPPAVGEQVRMHAAALLSTTSALSSPPENIPPLRLALARVTAGELAPDAACCEFITKENCSRSVDEWWYGHLLLMQAIKLGKVPASKHFEGNKNHWLERLYTPKTPLELGSKDYELVKQCFHDAEDAGVVNAEIALATVIVRQELLDEVHKLQDAGQEILTLLATMLLDQASLHEDLRWLGAKVSRMERIQHISTIMNAVCSPIPLAGGVVAGVGIGLAENAAQLVESLLGAGVGMQGAVAPSFLGRFVSMTDKFIIAWENVPPNDRAQVKLAAEGLGMNWEQFRSMIETASRRSRACEERSSEAPDVEVEVEEVVENVASGRASVDSCPADEEGASFEGSDASSPKNRHTLADESRSDSGEQGNTIDASREVREELKELRRHSSECDYVSNLQAEELSRLMAAGMINFNADYVEDLTKLAECLRRVITEKRLSGSLIVLLSPTDDFASEFVTELREDEAYAVLKSRWRAYETGLRLFFDNLRERAA